MFYTMLALSTLYQFWIHTRFVPKLGPLEWFLNTPSHHRVHHGRNPQYIDRNHGATLIIWDRLFGTFEEEGEKVVYGVTEPVTSWNPLWANFHYFRDTIDDTRRASRWRDKIKIWFMPPGWRPPSDGPFRQRSIPLDAPKYTTPLERGIAWYAVFQFVLAVVGAVVMLDLRAKDPRLDQLAPLAIVIVLTCVTVGGLLEGKPWAKPLEVARVLLVAVALSTTVLIPH
jgi:hypothetical protein